MIETRKDCQISLIQLPDSPEVALTRWLQIHETVKDYNRKEVLQRKRWEITRQQALQRDGFTCVWSGNPQTESRRLQVHHLIPLYAGGDPYDYRMTASLDQRSHTLMHPGLEKAQEEYRQGNKKAFQEWDHWSRSQPYIPTHEADVLMGIIFERNRTAARQRKVFDMKVGETHDEAECRDIRCGISS